jgi:putative ABC transport system permease protein
MPDADYLSFRDANRTFDAVATFAPAQSTLTGTGEATRLNGAIVTTGFFRVLHVEAVMGRTFEAQDEGAGNDRVVLLADSLWRRTFGASPDILDQSITLNGLPYRVIGILPAGFSYPADANYWIPLTVRLDPNLGYIRPVVGRLKPGVTRAQAEADLDVWARNLPPDPQRQPDVTARITPLHEAIVGEVRLPLLVFGGAVGLVLLIVCANVANLLLMRAVSRRQEIATRLALGANRGRLVRQLLTESAVLSIAGGLVGASAAVLLGPTVLSVIPSGRLPQDVAIRTDGWVLAFIAGLSVFTGIVVGLAPIMQTTRTTQFEALRAGMASATPGSYQLRHALVVAQVAFTLMLLAGAGLLGRSFIALRNVPLGFAADRVMTMTVDLPMPRYRSIDEAVLFHDRLLASLSMLPDVQSTAAVNWLPLGNMLIRGDVQAQDRSDLVGQYSAAKMAVSADYFATIGIRLLRGRPFTTRDRAGSEPVLIVSESVARRFWPDGEPIGKRVSLVDEPKPENWATVVGVVEDVRQGGFKDALAPAVYQPYGQVTNRFFVGYMTFLARTNGDPAGLAPLMRAAMHRVDPNEAPESLATLEAVIERSVAEPKFQTRVLAVFSIVALVLAAVGIYGVLASSVLERRVEIGVRMALGADRTSVVRLVLRRTMLLTAVGVGLGVAGSFLLTGVLETLLFNVAPTDAPTFILSTAVLVATAFAAALLPARRASAIDPLLALRCE